MGTIRRQSRRDLPGSLHQDLRTPRWQFHGLQFAQRILEALQQMSADPRADVMTRKADSLRLTEEGSSEVCRSTLDVGADSSCPTRRQEPGPAGPNPPYAVLEYLRQ